MYIKELPKLKINIKSKLVYIKNYKNFIFQLISSFLYK